jgi:iron complex transport system substrate-binding protein
MFQTRRQFVGLVGAAAAGLIKPARAQPRRVIVDSAGRRVEIPAQVRRIFAAGPPATIILFSLAPDTLIGWSRAIDPEERAFLPQRYADLPGLGRLTGRGNTANVEVVLAARPDLVFDYGSVAPTLVSLADRVQEQTGVPYVLVDGSFSAIGGAYTVLGELLGDPAGAKELARHAGAILAKVDEVLAKHPPGARPRVYYARGPRGLDTGLAGSINVEALDRVGAVNVAAEALGKGGLASVSLEQVLAWDPDVIVTIDENFYRAVGNDPAWGGVAAVKARRVYLSPTLPFGWVDSPPSVNRLIGLLWLVAVLYPGHYPGDLRQDVADFYERFYHQRPSPNQLDVLLRNTGGLRP